MTNLILEVLNKPTENTTRTQKSTSRSPAYLALFLIAGSLLWTPAQAQAPFRQEIFGVSGFLGASPFKSNSDIDHLTFVTGGFRVSEDIWKKFGLEQTFAWNASELEFHQPSYPPLVTIPATSLYTRNFRYRLGGLN